MTAWSKLRADFVAQVMKQIAGRENPAGGAGVQEAQVLKGITAAELVHKMDADYGVALSWNCTNCHRFAAQGDFANDTSNNKVRARFMQRMVNDINRPTAQALSARHTEDRLRNLPSRLQRAARAGVSDSRARKARRVASLPATPRSSSPAAR